MRPTMNQTTIRHAIATAVFALLMSTGLALESEKVIGDHVEVKNVVHEVLVATGTAPPRRYGRVKPAKRGSSRMP